MTDDHAAGYDFVKLGEGLATTLLKAAHEQVSQANHILEQTQSLADIIMTQVRAQASQIEDMNARFKSFGEQMLVAHRVLNGNVPVANPTGRLGGSKTVPDRTLGGDNDERYAAAAADLAKRRALAGNYGGRVNPPAREPDGPLGTAGPGPHPVGVSRAPDPARQGGGLPHALADLDRFRVNRADTGENRDDPGVGSKQPDRD